MSPSYPCGKPCSTGTHNENVKGLTLFSPYRQWDHDGIMASNVESHGNVICSSIASKILTSSIAILGLNRVKFFRVMLSLF